MPTTIEAALESHGDYNPYENTACNPDPTAVGTEGKYDYIFWSNPISPGWNEENFDKIMTNETACLQDVIASLKMSKCNLGRLRRK